jgi:hypothetical protein
MLQMRMFTFTNYLRSEEEDNIPEHGCLAAQVNPIRRGLITVEKDLRLSQRNIRLRYPVGL